MGHSSIPTGQPEIGIGCDRIPAMPTGTPDDIPSLADRLIREAMERGEFEGLPGSGKPIPGRGTTDDDGWWIRSWIARNTEPQSESKST